MEIDISEQNPLIKLALNIEPNQRYDLQSLSQITNLQQESIRNALVRHRIPYSLRPRIDPPKHAKKVYRAFLGRDIIKAAKNHIARQMDAAQEGNCGPK